MKELLQSHSIVANPASWILIAIVVVGSIKRYIEVFKSLEFDSLHKKAKYTLRELAILDVIVAAIVTIAIFMHYQLMNVDRPMFRIDRDQTTVTLKSKTPILIGDQFDIVKDDGPVLVVKSHRSHKEYRIEKFYLPAKGAND